MEFLRSLAARAAAVPLFAAAFVASALAVAAPAAAAQPEAWQLGMQPSASPVADKMHSFHDLLLVIIIAISLFVLALLLYVMFRFRSGANPVPSKTSHNTVIEIVWTVVPVLILVVIAVPSFRLLYYSDRAPDAEMTIKAVGHQWYWSYEYPDQGNFTFTSTMVADTDLQPGQPRLLAVDNPLVVPVGTKVRVLTNSEDVIHSWFVPSLGVQKYAMPGRTNETWLEAKEVGTFYGQCNQICGFNHAFMPIEVRVLSKEDFAKWVEEAKTKFARVDAPNRSVAAATLN